MTTKQILNGSVALLTLALPAFAGAAEKKTETKPAASAAASSKGNGTAVTENGNGAAPKVTKKPDVDVSYEELAVLYKNKDNPIIQRLSLYGEFSAQWAEGVSNQGSFGSRNLKATPATGSLPATPSTLWDSIDARRWRLGVRAQLFKDFKFTGIIDINPNFDGFYRDIYELYLTYAPNDAFNVSVGKRKAHFFSQEYNTPSRELIVFEQSLLTATLIPKEHTGIWVNGKIGNWIYTVAAYPGDYQTEFSHFNAGLFTQASLGYDFASKLHVDKALVKFDWQNSTSSKNNYGPQNFTNAFSLSTAFQQGRFYSYTDFLGGLGRNGQGDVWGMILTPTYFLIPDKLQFVLRYQYAHGDNNALKLQRYEILAPDLTTTTTTTTKIGKTTKTAVSNTGSEYQAVYFGLNYYIHRHNLKLMTGVEYSDLSGGKKNFSGWTYLAGLRLAF